jgi:DNA-binding transcriptional LysR family regulator
MDATDLRLDWLRAFLAVIETGGFTAAAARLHVSQPALHTQVKQLAAWAGPLYRFEGRKLHLTPRGQQVEVLARDVLAAIDRFVAVRAGDAATPRSSAPAGPAAPPPGPGAARLAGPLSLRTEDRAATVEAMRSGRAHLGLTVLLEADRALVSVLVLEVGQVAVIPTATRWPAPQRLRVRELAGRPLIVPPPGRAATGRRWRRPSAASCGSPSRSTAGSS